MKKIIEIIKLGWLAAGSDWRETAADCNVDPDKLMELPESTAIFKKVIALPKQQQVIFFNTLSRKYPSIRIN